MAASNNWGLINFKNYYLYPVAYYSKIWDKFDMVYHSHPYYEIMYVEDGECNIKLYLKTDNDEIQKTTIMLSKNMAIFINSNINHRLIVSEGAKMLHLEFERRDIKNIAESIDFSFIINHTQLLKMLLIKNSYYYVLKDANEAISPIKRIHAELMANMVLHDDNFFLLQSYIIELFIKMAKINRDSAYKGGIVYIKKAISFIRENYTKQISVDMIAESLGVSNGYLHKLVKDETGKTLVEIINSYRINKAKQLISTTTFPLIDIAIECGFNNRQNFYHIFKNLVGMSPHDYKKGKGSYDLYHFGNDYVNSLGLSIETDS